MWIYILVFTVSGFLIAIAQKQRKDVFYAVSFVAILLPCLLAGLRYESIGTDVLVYVKQIYEGAISSDGFLDFFNYNWYATWRYKYVYEFEPLFILIIYLISRIVGSFQLILFVIQALTIVPIYVALVKVGKEKFSLRLAMMTFYLFYFNTSLNTMRQFIAIAFVFLGFTYFLEKKNKLSFFFLIIAILFHYSALISLIIYISYLFVKKNKKIIIKIYYNLKIKLDVRIVLLLIIPIICLLFNSLVVIALDIFGLSSYASYIFGDVSFLPNQFILRLPIFCLIFINWKQLNLKYEHISFYTLMLYFDLIISQFNSVNQYAGRIGLFFSIFSLILIPLICNCNKSKVINLINTIICLIYLSTYWIYYFVISGSSETVPYIFA